MDAISLGAAVGLIALIAGGIGVWVSLRERLVRAETKIEGLEANQRDHKSDLVGLREWLEIQFDTVRKEIARKADKGPR